jgi:predicted secreted protein
MSITDPVAVLAAPTTSAAKNGHGGVAFVAHCLLNQNSKVGDAAHCAGIYSPIVDTLRARDWRIEQMPCPELTFAGLNRFWLVREQLDTAAYRSHCRTLATTVADMIGTHVANNRDVILIGVEGSPSLGIHVTSSDPSRGGKPRIPELYEDQKPGEGIFVEALRRELGLRSIDFPRSAAETVDLPDHDTVVERVDLESLLDER